MRTLASFRANRLTREELDTVLATSTRNCEKAKEIVDKHQQAYNEILESHEHIQELYAHQLLSLHFKAMLVYEYRGTKTFMIVNLDKMDCRVVRTELLPNPDSPMLVYCLDQDPFTVEDHEWCFDNPVELARKYVDGHS